MGQKEHFIGTWALVELYIMKVNGTHVHPFGKNPSGMLIYNNEGYMSTIITGENQPNNVPLDFKNTSAEEQALAVKHISYCGLFKVKKNIITHCVHITLFPQWKGTQLKRYYKFKGENNLILTTNLLI
ncbi:lipocalin-like domain-containing protein [Bacillus cereus]|uniref:lipocalin-like domain-containing protein n=1 Tax=Bacillus cereus TaxID=1396 RepID=UPI003304DB16|nr:lipocalin-like domain-containing protein [Bacillus cereus]HDR7713904.1 lipocalin-like domain-containing protein [Bacillus cereus]